MKYCIINGPNLNLVGVREKSHYGNISFDDYFYSLKEQFPNVHLEYFQSNIEGEIVSKIQEVGFGYSGIILNAAAYTHSSIAIRDAVAAIRTPVIEVHISNIFAREDFRHKSMISPVSIGIISGLGLDGYTLALVHLISKMQLQ